MKKYGGGKADDYLTFIVKRLKPYVDKNLHKTNQTKKHIR
jgi:predicted alpha/beta superfamily hydrolase